MQLPFDFDGKSIYVAGHGGMVGSAICRALLAQGQQPIVATRREVDLERQADVEAWFARHRPQVVMLAAAQVGGIVANKSFPRDFIYRNLMISANVIDAAWKNGCEKFVFLGSSCIYPKEAEIPIREEALLSGPLELTNEWYAVAKIAGIKLGQAYRKQYGFDVISLMPTNLYGEGDNYHPEHGHVIAGLIRRFHEAKLARQPAVTVWGTGKPRREFLHVDDFSAAIVHALQHYSDDLHLNIGSDSDVTIAELAGLIAKVVGYEGELQFDTSKPDGTMRKLLDASRIHAMGWKATIPLEDGLRTTYADFLAGGGRNR